MNILSWRRHSDFIGFSNFGPQFYFKSVSSEISETDEIMEWFKFSLHFDRCFIATLQIS